MKEQPEKDLQKGDYQIQVIESIWLAKLLGPVLAVLAFPHVIIRISNKMMDQPLLTRIAGAVWILIGGFLTYKGYF